MEEIEQKRNIIHQKLDHLVRASNNANHRKIKNKLRKELDELDEKSKQILKSKIDNGKISI